MANTRIKDLINTGKTSGTVMKKISAISIFILLLALAGNALSQEPLQVTFQRSASVDAGEIRLGDIVTFSQDNETTKALASIIVGDSPEPGERILLRSVLVRNTLLRNNNIPRDTYWRGSGTVSVLRQGVKIDSDRILGYIRDYIENAKANLPDAEVRFIPKALPATLSVPTGKLSCEVIPSHPDLLRSQRFSLIFRISDRVVKNMSVIGTMEAITDIVVSAHPLKRGQQLDASDLTLARMNISGVPDACTETKEFVGKKMRTTLRAGLPLLTRMVEDVPIIKKDDPVKITVHSGPMLLTATGYALSNGSLNQVIMVRNSSSDKMLRARITAPGIVEVAL